MPAPATAVDQQVIWKHPEMQLFAVSLVENALRLLNAGTVAFTTDIVPDDDRGDGDGVPGSVVTQLKHANIIAPVGVLHAGKFYQDREISKRESGKSRYVNKYQLCSRAVAEEFLRRNHRPVESQSALAIA